MREIILRNKTGFKITRPETPVIIRDTRGILFYSTEPITPKVKQFNLPPGKYLVDQGSFTPLARPIEYPLKKLPPKQRNRKFPKDFKMKWGNNPNKCTVDWDRKTITFDTSFQESPLSHLDFIKFHEFGHARYGVKQGTDPDSEAYRQSEAFADLFAVNCMLLKGYNPEQIAETQIDSLSSSQKDRKEFIANIISNT